MTDVVVVPLDCIHCEEFTWTLPSVCKLDENVQSNDMVFRIAHPDCPKKVTP